MYQLRNSKVPKIVQLLIHLVMRHILQINIVLKQKYPRSLLLHEAVHQKYNDVVLRQ